MKYNPERSSRVARPVEIPDYAVPAWIHPEARQYLQERGMTEEEVQSYEFMYCERGYWARRVLIPMFNAQGVLVCLQGRAIDAQTERYLTYGLKPFYCPWDVSDVGSSSSLLVVEGAFDCVAIARIFPHVGAILGSEPSQFQIHEIIEMAHACHAQRIGIWLDADGSQYAYALKLKLRPYMSVYVLDFQTERLTLDVKDPGSCHPEQVIQILKHHQFIS